MVKKANEVTIRQCASLAAQAWSKLEAAAQEALNGGQAPTMQMVANTDGISALVKDAHGTTVLIQGGKISVNVAGVNESGG